MSNAREFFSAHRDIHGALLLLEEVGVGYLQVGQPSPTLSGGEAQRIKLARELSKRATGDTLYILDEPTTGLHFADVKKLLEVLHRLVDAGNTVVVIEHNLDVIKTADFVLDLGPDGGPGGGELIAQGTPEEIAQNAASVTGKYLGRLLGGKAAPARAAQKAKAVVQVAEAKAAPRKENGAARKTVPPAAKAKVGAASKAKKRGSVRPAAG